MKILFIFTFCCLVQAEEIIKLSKLQIKESQVTVMGFSSGSSMATQFHIAHSSLFSGVGLFSQAVWFCGHKSLIDFASKCSIIHNVEYDVEDSIKQAEKYEAQGLIDSLANLKKQKVFVQIGALDEWISPDAALKSVPFYERFMNKSRIHSYVDPNQSHLVPTERFGDPCNASSANNYYLGNCGYSLPFKALRFLHGTQIKQPRYDIELSPLRKYNQSEFYNGNISNVAMGEVGFIFIPDNCKNKRCLLNFFFHGCDEWPPSIAEKMIRNSGFLEIAQLSDLILVFPLTTSVSVNHNGCWDFFSYTGEDFATKKGAQIEIVYKIHQRIVNGSERLLIT